MTALASLPLDTPLPTFSSNLPTLHKLTQKFQTLLTQTYDPAQHPDLAPLALELAQFSKDVEGGTSRIHFVSISGPYGIGKTEMSKTLCTQLSQCLGPDMLHQYVTVMQDASDLEGTQETPSNFIKSNG